MSKNVRNEKWFFTCEFLCRLITGCLLCHFAGKRILKYLLPLTIAVLLIPACASLPKNYPRTFSTAFQNHSDTAIGKRLEEMAAEHRGMSGFSTIRNPRPAFKARIMLIDLAEKSLDLQYYIWKADATGRILTERLVRAADRGVKVRILVDDMHTNGSDAYLASMNAHCNIEIRIFNPFARRGSRALGFLADMNRLNHRMHNKIMVMDNALAIVGGRNVGNHYFGVDTESNFRDLDLAAAGPVVREISDMFDTFWNGEWSYPFQVLIDRPYASEDLRMTMGTVRKQIDDNHFPHPVDQDVANLKSELNILVSKFIWAEGRIYWDNPADKFDKNARGETAAFIFEKIGALRKELLLESAYFVVRQNEFETIKQLSDRGVRIRMLTNSLVSTDVLAAHAGYSKFRTDLIESGMELYEFRPDAGAMKLPARQSIVAGESKAALHTKAMVFDRESVFIGSFNLDPRSAEINMEAGLHVNSPELARQVIAHMDEGVEPENSYRVLLDENGDLLWITINDSRMIRYVKDPESKWWQRFMTGMIRMLPVHDQL